MPLGNKPVVFVSSTCYDLGQVRTDLKASLEAMGLETLLSEYSSFPVNPDEKTVANCLIVVEKNADIFVLIVGGRYGHQVDDGKSVTNKEYLRAKAKGIPIYVFIKTSILNILPVWQKNKDGDFSDVVDSNALFTFVEQLRSDTDGHWVYPFEREQEIADTLLHQLAHLFMDALQLRTRFKATGLPSYLADLTGLPLRLVIEQSPYWEYRLFAHVLQQEIERLRPNKLDLQYGIAMGSGKRIDGFLELVQWARGRLADVSRIGDAAGAVLNQALQDGIAPHGTPGDAALLVYSARRCGGLYEGAIAWAIEAHRVDLEEHEFERMVEIVSKALDGLLKNLVDWAAMLVKTFDDAAANPRELKEGEEPEILELTLKIKIDLDDFSAELERLRNLHEAGLVQ